MHYDSPHMAMRNLELDDVAVFVQVVESGGVTAASRVMELPKSSVSRRVTRLEQRIGTQLLQRTTRSVTPTEAGREFYTRASAALAEVRDAASAAYDEREIPRGTVRFMAPPDIGAEVLPALIAAFVTEYPLVRVDIDLSASPALLSDASYDLALHIGRAPELGITSVKLQDMAFGLYASRGYLARSGTPSAVADLAGHDCVLFHASRGRSRWTLHREGAPDGAPSRYQIDVSGPISANDITFVRRAAVAGAGIALLPRLVGEAAIAQGDLVGILPEYVTASQPLFLGYPASFHTPLAVRALRDHLLQSFPK
jgi:DNA-binding transcriptional LysR family regulator